MNYQRLYDELIAFRQSNPPTGYAEKHHIIMTSMGGSNNKSNLVRLTGREHWIAHLYLYKIHRNKQTAHACHMMAMRCEERGIPQVRNSRMYEILRKECARLVGIATSKLKGSRNSQFGTRWICNIDLKENKKLSKREEIPDGWILGRNKWVVKKQVTNHREKLSKPLCITNGVENTRLHWKDQCIPEGWRIGQVLSDRHKKILSDSITKRNFKLRGTSGQGGRHKHKAGLM